MTGLNLGLPTAWVVKCKKCGCTINCRAIDPKTEHSQPENADPPPHDSVTNLQVRSRTAGPCQTDCGAFLCGYLAGENARRTLNATMLKHGLQCNNNSTLQPCLSSRRESNHIGGLLRIERVAESALAECTSDEFSPSSDFSICFPERQLESSGSL